MTGVLPKILIIDDEEDVALFAGKRIQANGMHVATWPQGKGAIEKVILEKPDAILLDIRLPDLSGVELFHELKSHAETHRIPIIFFSANPLKEEYCRQDLKAEGFLRKPYESEDLIREIELALKISEVGGSSPNIL